MSNKTRGMMCFFGYAINMGSTAIVSSIVVLTMLTLTQTIGCTMVQASANFSFLSAGCLVATLFAGSLFSKYNPKIIAFIGAIPILLFTGAIGLGLNIYIIWATSFLFGIGVTLNAQTAGTILITQWFSKGTGTLLTSAYTIRSLMSSIATPIVASMIAASGLISVFHVGIILFAMTSLSSFLLYQKFPAAYGMKPATFGKDKPEKKVRKKLEVYEAAMPINRIVKMPIFWLALLCPLFATLSNMFLYGNISFIFQDMGIDLVGVGFMISLINIGMMVSAPLFGFLSDIVGPKWGITVYAGICGLLYFGFSLLTGYTGAVILVVLYTATVYGNYYGALMMPVLFGVKKSPKLISWSQTANSLGTVIAPPVAATLAQASGGFVMPIAIGGFLMILLIIFTHKIAGQKSRERMIKIDKPYKEQELGFAAATI